MATNEKYYFGQGKLYSRRYGVPGAKWRWWGDVSELTFGGSSETIPHKESYSGKKALVRKISIAPDMSLSGTMHQIDTVSLAEMLYGIASEIAGGVVSNEPIADIEVGDIIKLDYPGVSELILKDSAGTPITVDPKFYDLDPRFGNLEILGLPTPALTMPLTAGYKYAPHKQVNFFSQPQAVLELKYEGLNLAESEEPTIVEFYKISSEPLQELSLITSGNNLAGTKFSMSALIDSSKPVAGPLGQFGRLITVGL